MKPLYKDFIEPYGLRRQRERRNAMIRHWLYITIGVAISIVLPCYLLTH